MANEEHLAKLKEGVDSWKRENPDVRPDLPDADLLEADLIGVNLYRADLYGADLRDADLSNATLVGEQGREPAPESKL